ncbi:hypothetical protein O1611_g1879 [Lasiodiplodia mahajangana]|uniref:Uncharacterized protein n=1 Tax=Lasiodiplodia mahajangana TaxID=1108764 RepID=A0ACC2JW49_9PEZI|nr:hypothetical protein O1611_g1879 [Lasiodiplodia mahajangana]
MSTKHTRMLLTCFVALFCVVIAKPTRISTLNKRNDTWPILQTKGGITRHLGISRPRKFETVWTWSLDSDGSLSWGDFGSSAGWQTYNSSLFISAPEVLNVWASSQDLRVAFAIQKSTGHLLYLPYFGGKWESTDTWHDLGGRFTYRPAAVSGTNGLSGVFGVNENGELLYSSLENQYFLPLEWNDWVVMGTGVTGEVAVAAADPGTWEIVGLVNGTYQHGLTDYRGTPAVWTDLGLPPNSVELGWPKIFAKPDLRSSGNPRPYIDVVVVTDGVAWHKFFNGTAWPEEWTRLPPSHDGLEITNSQEFLIGYGNSVSPIYPSNGYLFSRGSDDCVYQNQFGYSGYDPTTGQSYMDWLGWNSLWCPAGDSNVPNNIGQPPLAIAAIAQYDNRFDIVVETPSGTLEHAQVYHDNGTFESVVPKWEPVEGRPL